MRLVSLLILLVGCGSPISLDRPWGQNADFSPTAAIAATGTAGTVVRALEGELTCTASAPASPGVRSLLFVLPAQLVPGDYAIGDNASAKMELDACSPTGSLDATSGVITVFDSAPGRLVASFALVVDGDDTSGRIDVPICEDFPPRQRDCPTGR